MKNIKIYCPIKYDGDNYTRVKDNIYKTVHIYEESDTSLSLKGVTDQALLDKLRSMTEWKQGEREIELEAETLIIWYNGKKYYKYMDDEETIYENMYDESGETIYVTSLMFEQEPEFDENEPSNPEISQYPLEDILDEYLCYVTDFYEDENARDKVNSYVEFASEDISDIEKLLSIVGKHVYNREDGDYIKLVIE
ncbi:MAG: hypothetical protein K2G45_13230 [Lachnospiraceae bacterium]|nr:hypothetical protein [Lachnospiraceae bacterium]